MPSTASTSPSLLELCALPHVCVDDVNALLAERPTAARERGFQGGPLSVLCQNQYGLNFPVLEILLSAAPEEAMVEVPVVKYLPIHYLSQNRRATANDAQPPLRRSGFRDAVRQ